MFSFEDEEIIESQSFSFETEEKKIATPIVEEKTFFVEKKKEEIKFQVEEKLPEVKENITETKTFVEERPVEFTFSFTKEAEEIKPSFKTTIKEEKILETHKNESKINTSEDFKFIEKAPSNDKVQERRNKLKEFNSRYQVIENENEFESIPAFKRKNINIGHENPSQQQISSFLSDNNGRVSLRENKFLNKDVD